MGSSIAKHARIVLKKVGLTHVLVMMSDVCFSVVSDNELQKRLLVTMWDSVNSVKVTVNITSYTHVVFII